jgi:methionyl aminopeptidase
MSPTQLSAMTYSGHQLALIKKFIAKFAQTERSIQKIEQKVTQMIKSSGAKPSFKMVKGYSWSTCINVNDSIVHGIPQNGFLSDGDLVTVDLGLYYQGYHVDSATSFIIGRGTQATRDFLTAGQTVLSQTIKQAVAGHTIKDLSRTMQTGIEKFGYQAVRQLTGHGVGRQLHEYPPIPCYVTTGPEMSVPLKVSMTIAIEVMYTAGDWQLTTDRDGWTMRTKDGSLAAVVEETVAITDRGPIALTAIAGQS